MFYYGSYRSISESDETSSTNLSLKRNFSSFDFLREGDIDPALGKMIHVLIENGGDFIVYLDSEMNIQYAVSPDYPSFSPFYGKVLNKVAELEGLADKSFMTKKQIREYRCMIGAAIARMYEHESREVIFEMLDKSEYFLKSRVTETARIWYLLSASISLLVLIFLFFLLPSPNSGNIFFPGILMGAAGAYLSLVMNSKRIVVNPSSGRTIHFFESITRLIIGMIGGFFTSIIFQAEIITVGFLENHFLNSLIFAFTAGFSERMVPNMIYHFEEVNGKNSVLKTNNGT